MAVTTLIPLAQGAQTGWTLGAGASKPVAVRTNDGDTTYNFQNGASPLAESYSVDALPADAATVDAAPDLRSVARRSSGGSTHHRNEWNINGASTIVGSCVDPTASYTTNTSTAIARPGGGSFIPADFNGLTTGFQIGFGSCNTGVADTTRCTMATIDVTWTANAGGFIYLMGCWIPPLIAVASHGLSIAEIASFLRAKAGCCLDCALEYRFKTRPGGPSMRQELDMVHRAYFVRPRFAF